MRALLVLPLALGLLAAGCVTPPADEVDAASLAPDGTIAAAGEAVTINEAGATWDGAAVCSPVAPCAGATAPARGGPAFFEQTLKGTLDGAELVLSWDATTPATEELLLGIAYMKSEDEMDWIYATGTSPLTLSEKGLGIPAATVEAIYVSSYKCAPTPVAPCASTSQEFTLEGTLTLLPSAAETTSE